MRFRARRPSGLRGCAPKQWRTTTVPEPDPANIPLDRVKRKFDQGLLDAVWVGDITYIRTWTGWLDLATGIDAHPRRAVGWAPAAPLAPRLVRSAPPRRNHPLAARRFESALSRSKISRAVIKNCDQSEPLVDGTPDIRESKVTASRRALATALNCASSTWWALRPSSTRTCKAM